MMGMAAFFFTGLGGQSVNHPAELETLGADVTGVHVHGIGPAGIRRLRALPALSRLEVSSSFSGSGISIGDEVFEEIAHLPGLTALALTNWHGSGCGLARLAALPNLRALYVRFTTLTAAGAAEIGQL